jgi:two-component system sensor histidine kinase VanS
MMNQGNSIDVSQKRYKNEKIFSMRHSLRVKLTFTLTVLIIFTILFFLIINRTFLEDYYLHNKINGLGSAYNEINNIFIDKSDFTDVTKEDRLKVEKISEKNNVRIYILRGINAMAFPETEYDVRVSEKIIETFESYYYPERNADIQSIALLKTNPNYSIFKLQNYRLESQNIDLIGLIGNNFDICIRANYESMKESVSIANEFFAYIGILVVVMGSIIMFYISKRFTMPILQLSNIAKKMSDLNFDVKYNVDTQDEVGELGHSINALSEKLEKTISELKSVNNELLTDIEQKIQIDEMRKDFLSNVTHELKTPIALIQGYAEGLKDNINDDEESREFYCEVIIDEAMKMNTMVKKLLSLNQIEFGNNQVNITRFDIVELIKSVLISTEILFKQKEVKLLFDDREAIYVWSDEYMIEEVITNYISNALNHVSGAKIIEIMLIRKENSIRVAVFNTGANIPEEDIDNIWIKFYKVDKARTREYGGNGIGLSIVKAIMTSLNQSFGVNNHKTGVEFWFEIDTKTE